jgi:hypothetical protein
MTIAGFIAERKEKYIENGKRKGGNRAGFLDFLKKDFNKDAGPFVKLAFEMLMESGIRGWERPPRKRGPDLFSINEYTVPDTLTRPAHDYANADDLDDEHGPAFEKVSQKYAVVQDLIDDATIKLRKAAQSSATAEREMKAADEALRRAHGDRNKALRDIADDRDDDAPAWRPQPQPTV